VWKNSVAMRLLFSRFSSLTAKKRFGLEKIHNKMSEGLENEKQTHLFRSTVFESRAAGVNV